MRYLIILLVSLLPTDLFAAACSSTIAQGSTESCDSITINTITWTFQTNYTVGQFVNRDYFVVDSGSGVVITDITPNSVTATRTINGSMINPTNSTTQGFDESMQYNTYSDALNVGLDIVSGGSNLTIYAGDSLVSGRSNATAQSRPQLTDSAILTCLSSAPASGSFRPFYGGTTKTIYNISSINYSVLGSLDCNSGETGYAPLATWESRMSKYWWEASENYQAQFPRASNHFPGMANPAYGSDMALWTGGAVLRLQCNDSNAEKYQLLVYMLQYAIDISGAIANNGVDWSGDGGHPHGRKSVLALGAAVLGSSTMQSQLNYANGVLFGEDNTVVSITSDWYSTTMCAWDSNYCGLAACQYNSTDHPVGTPEWRKHPGQATIAENCAAYGSNTGGTGYVEYRDSYGGDVPGMLAALIMGMESTWNRSLSFDYAERFEGFLDDGYTFIGGYSEWVPNAWMRAMYDDYWNTYRGYVAPAYGGKSVSGGGSFLTGGGKWIQ